MTYCLYAYHPPPFNNQKVQICLQKKIADCILIFSIPSILPGPDVTREGRSAGEGQCFPWIHPSIVVMGGVNC